MRATQEKLQRFVTIDLIRAETRISRQSSIGNASQQAAAATADKDPEALLNLPLGGGLAALAPLALVIITIAILSREPSR